MLDKEAMLEYLSTKLDSLQLSQSDSIWLVWIVAIVFIAVLFLVIFLVSVLPVIRVFRKASIRGKKEIVGPPYIGIQMMTLTPEWAERNNKDPNAFYLLPSSGVLVTLLSEDGPAAAAGIRRGDTITQVNRQKITTVDQVQNIVADSIVGSRLQFKLKRGDRFLKLKVRTASLPSG
ncbi:MAG: PDZ domain-containing protein [Hormoscilla sp.]